MNFEFNSRIVGGRMFSDGGEQVCGDNSVRMTLPAPLDDPFPTPSRWVRFTSSIKEAVRAWKRQRWLRQRRASIPDPFN